MLPRRRPSPARVPRCTDSRSFVHRRSPNCGPRCTDEERDASFATSHTYPAFSKPCQGHACVLPLILVAHIRAQRDGERILSKFHAAPPAAPSACMPPPMPMDMRHAHRDEITLYTRAHVTCCLAMRRHPLQSSFMRPSLSSRVCWRARSVTSEAPRHDVRACLCASGRTFRTDLPALACDQSTFWVSGVGETTGSAASAASSARARFLPRVPTSSGGAISKSQSACERGTSGSLSCAP